MSRTRRPRHQRRPTPARTRPRREPETVLRGGPHEFAAALPEILGFPPRESLVLICLGGAGRPPRRMSLDLRVDLADPRHDRLLAAEVLSPVSRMAPLPAAALVFVVTEDPDDRVASIRPDPWRTPVPDPDAGGLPDLPRRALVHACIEELSALGIETVDAVLVRADRWWSYPDVDPVTGAGPGEPLDHEGSRLTGMAALRGTVVAADRAAVVGQAWPRTPVTRHMETACLWADSEVGDLVDAGVAGPEIVDRCWAAVRDALAAHAPGTRAALTDDAAAAVGIALQLVPVRDRALALVAAAEDDETAAAQALWTDLNARLPAELAGVPALLLGCTAWLQGSGVLAVAALERSCAVDPTPMGEMLLQLLAAGTPPDVLRGLMCDPEDAEVA
ncbi:DUF4192 domain-containing protein [Geodermatophilus sp. Leaf369]|uniref:DUF4192 domain-containing protein n=1 Tax=Geodermatophilus sp. Leaf369 TaxID=1736354 RepID=UPI0009EA9E3C|nr:DUF4192 domain-containing protein [Geodermatophilus sp. Leaf369]